MPSKYPNCHSDAKAPAVTKIAKEINLIDHLFLTKGSTIEICGLCIKM